LRRRQFLGSLGLIAVGGCASNRPPPVDFSELTHTYGPNDYGEVYRRWTRHGELVRDVGTVIEIWATYKSWDFRQAYIEQYADVYGLGEAERRALRQAQLQAARTSYEFHVNAQSTEYKWNDLEQKDSVWKISLVDGHGGEVAPEGITIERLPELYEMRFFPMKTDFTRTYTARFPRAPVDGDARFVGSSTGRLILRLTGPLGKAEASWESGGKIA
jgi:hypothetical protein